MSPEGKVALRKCPEVAESSGDEESSLWGYLQAVDVGVIITSLRGANQRLTQMK